METIAGSPMAMQLFGELVVTVGARMLRVITKKAAMLLIIFGLLIEIAAKFLRRRRAYA